MAAAGGPVVADRVSSTRTLPLCLSFCECLWCFRTGRNVGAASPPASAAASQGGLCKHNTIMLSTATLLLCPRDKTRSLSSHNFYESVLICRWRAHIPRHGTGSSCLSTSSCPHGDQCQRWLGALGFNGRLLCVDGAEPHVVFCGTLKQTRGIVASLLLSLAKRAFNK